MKFKKGDVVKLRIKSRRIRKNYSAESGALAIVRGYTKHKSPYLDVLWVGNKKGIQRNGGYNKGDFYLASKEEVLKALAMIV